jgi:hypothetical protein
VVVVWWNELAPSDNVSDRPFGFVRFKLRVAGRDGGDDPVRRLANPRGTSSGGDESPASLTLWIPSSRVGVIVDALRGWSMSSTPSGTRLGDGDRMGTISRRGGGLLRICIARTW